MTLIVEPAALSGYARQVDRAAEDLASIKSYLARYATAAGAGGELYDLAKEGHKHSTGVLDETLNRLTALLQASAAELNSAAAYYRRTDLQAAVNLDATLPASLDRCPTSLEWEFTSNPCPPPPFADPRHVADRLTVPPEPDNPSNSLGFMDYLSPTAWAMKGFDVVLGFDPIGLMQERLFGDWEALATMAPVLANTGTALHDLALNVQSGITTLQPLWEGNAGNAAYNYFTELASAIAALEGPIHEIGREYLTMADAVWSIGEAIGGLIKGMIDTAIIIGIAAAAGTATAATGVGALVGYGVATLEVANLLRLWAQATKLYQQVGAAVLAFRAALSKNLSELDTVRLPALPGGDGYDHPLVAASGARHG